MTKGALGYFFFLDRLLVIIGCISGGVFFLFSTVVHPSLAGIVVVFYSIIPLFSCSGGLAFFGDINAASSFSSLSASSAQLKGGGGLKSTLLSILVSGVSEALILSIPGSREVEALLFD